MINIGSLNLVPYPKITINPEYFYFGSEVIGGYFNVELQGVHYADDDTDFTTKINSVAALAGSCQSINIDPACASGLPTGDPVFFIDGSMGRIKESTVSLGSSPMDFNYKISIECCKDNTKTPLIQNTSSIDFPAYFSKGNKVIVKSYSEKVTAKYDNLHKFVIDSKTIYKTYGSFTVDLEIALYPSDQCDSNNINYSAEVDRFLRKRAKELLANPKLVGINFPPNKTFCGVNYRTSSKGTYVGALTFEIYVLPSNSSSTYRALVDLAQTEETDPITKGGKATIKGSIVGLDTYVTGTLNSQGDCMSNAWSAYNHLKDYKVYANTLNILYNNDCAKTSVPPETGDRRENAFGRYVQTNTRVSSSTESSRIDFEFAYEDKEKCKLNPYTISVEYEEKHAKKKRAEHIAPGRPSSYEALTYYSYSVNAPTYKLTVQGQLPKTCLQNDVGGVSNSSGDYFKHSMNFDPMYSAMVTAVGNELSTQKTRWKLNPSNNVMYLGGSSKKGRYEYTITEEYIKCQR